MSEDFNIDSLSELYLYESTSLIDSLDNILLKAEADGALTSGNINEIFRITHTIKGSSTMMAYKSVSEIAHMTEDLFAAIRIAGLKTAYFNELIDIALAVSDFLRTEIAKMQDGRPLETEIAPLAAAVSNLTGKILKREPDKLAADISKLTARAASAISPPGTKETYYLHVHFNEGARMENIRAFMLVKKLGEKGIVNRTIPENPETDPGAESDILQQGFYISFTTSLFHEQIEALIKGSLSVETVSFVRKMPDDPNGTEAALKQQIPEPRPKPIDDVSYTRLNREDSQRMGCASLHASQNIIGVELKKLDDLLNIAGKILVNESVQSSSQLKKLADELHDKILAIRMQPVSLVFQRMHRIVRDMNKNLSKEAALILAGETTEVDKTILDALPDPIMHLVRNAMDHAIESPRERAGVGKTAVGSIVLSAQNSGSDVIISVRDDGRGIDKDLILNKARALGLLQKPDDEYTDKDVSTLLMTPGFSTKESVSAYSGRGVGLDVVKNNIEKIGGSILIESKKGLGTNVILKIPIPSIY